MTGMGVAPVGVQNERTGHHHLLIDTKLSDEELKRAIAADAQHVHFGGGQTETMVTLPPGQHTLQLVLGDHSHVPHNPPVMSPVVTITVTVDSHLPPANRRLPYKVRCHDDSAGLMLVFFHGHGEYLVRQLPIGQESEFVEGSLRMGATGAPRADPDEQSPFPGLAHGVVGERLSSRRLVILPGIVAKGRGSAPQTRQGLAPAGAWASAGAHDVSMLCFLNMFRRPALSMAFA
jgi:hypothetical protein